MKKDLYKNIIQFIVIVLVSWIFFRQYVRAFEDIINHFYMGNPELHHPMETWTDAIESNLSSYMKFSGRLLAFTFQSWIPNHLLALKICFFLNSLMFAWIVLVLAKIAKSMMKPSANTSWMTMTTLLTILLLVPSIGYTYFGFASYFINYLWTSFLYVNFYLVFIYIKKNHNKINNYTLMGAMLFSVIVGSWQESFTIPIGATYFIYFISNYKKISKKEKFLFYSYVFGGGILVFAPGNFIRFTMGQENVATKYENFAFLHRFYGMVNSLLIVQVYILFLIIGGVIHRKNLIGWLKNRGVFILPPLFSLLFAVFVSFDCGHQITVMSVCLSPYIVYCIHWLLNRYVSVLVRYGYKCLTVLILLGICVPSYYYRDRLLDAWKEFEVNCRTSKNGEVIAEKLYNLKAELKGTFYYDYVCSLAFWHLSAKDLNPTWSAHFSDFKNFNQVQNVLPVSPECIVSKFNNQKEMEYVFLSDKDFGVMKVPASCNIENIVLRHKGYRPLLSRIKDAIYGVDKYYEDRLSDNVNFFSQGGFKYYIVYDFGPEIQFKNIKK